MLFWHLDFLLLICSMGLIFTPKTEHNYLWLLWITQVDDRQVASDGFMLNIMTVLQQLCAKVKIEKVKKGAPVCKIEYRMEI